MKRERIREKASAPPSPDFLRAKAEEGWRLVALEWEREVDEQGSGADLLKEEIPYGLRVSADCRHLEEDPEEKQALTLMLELIVEDKPLSVVADGLNRQGLRTRNGEDWTQTSVFYMLPRLIEAAPMIFSSREWIERRSQVEARMAELLE